MLIVACTTLGVAFVLVMVLMPVATALTANEF